MRSHLRWVQTEACLVRGDRRLWRLCCGSGEHPPRRQLVPIDGMPSGNFCQDTLEVCLGIYAVELCRLHESIDGSSTIAAGIGSTEEVVLPPDRHCGVILPMSGMTSLSTTGGTRFTAVVFALYIKGDEPMATWSTLRPILAQSQSWLRGCSIRLPAPEWRLASPVLHCPPWSICTTY
jgi:hypothetical protein